MDNVNVAIIYYSATGTLHAPAQAAAKGAQEAGAHVRLRRVAETAPPQAVNSKATWAQHSAFTASSHQARRVAETAAALRAGRR
ncbi:hypothetical protein ACWEJ6_51925 [Nonomuraea sp. NPDC004702]